ncbi:MAG: glycoside hydrolase family 3 N-terminal domain-containing protein [Thermodesulfovibrionales bacterium]
MNFYKFIIARLNGRDIEKEFDYYLRLVKKGIAGFIVFGGELNTVRQGISELQKEADESLIIASDLEQGLGQQLVGDSTLREGGTIFPPAMAVASAIKKDSSRFTVHGSQLKLLRKVFKAIAIEARYAGINTIFAPVLDINTNPRNPIISTRAFGEDPESVSFFGCEMIKTFQSHGITACGKHFPGHGDTETDSHIKLPKIKKDIKALSKTELAPFRNAVKAGVRMIMMGHLNVPALDPSGIPVSLSQKAVSYLRKNLGFKGIVITDAMNMGGIGRYSEEEASLMALNAGVDILLHPTNPDNVVSYLSTPPRSPLLRGGLRGGRRLRIFRDGLIRFPSKALPDFESHGKLSEELTEKAIKVSGEIKIKGEPYLVVLSDEENPPLPPFTKGGMGGFLGNVLAEKLKGKFPDLKLQIIKHDSEIQKVIFPDNSFAIVAVFSGIRAWKGGPSPWLLKCITELKDKAKIFVSFGSPYLLDRVGNDTARIYAYWDSEAAQKAVAEVIMQR